jgi:hypothetical protein
MTTALVRIKDDKQLVGIFTYQTEDVGELFNLVDQCMNPNECEYIEIHYGGFYWFDKVDYIKGLSEMTDREINEGQRYDNATPCEYLCNTIDDAEDMWHDIDRET